ncbi:hypothetical protein ACLOJK_003805, partial [Asimina triloba]
MGMAKNAKLATGIFNLLHAAFAPSNARQIIAMQEGGDQGASSDDKGPKKRRRKGIPMRAPTGSTLDY